MKAQDILDQLYVDASEWLEMADNPDMLMSGILAHRMAVLYDRIEYLERRIFHESHSKN